MTEEEEYRIVDDDTGPDIRRGRAGPKHIDMVFGSKDRKLQVIICDGTYKMDFELTLEQAKGVRNALESAIENAETGRDYR